MHTVRRSILWVSLLIFMTACQPVNANLPETEPDQGNPEGIDPSTLPLELVTVEEGQIRQWAAGAKASSEYSAFEWSADQAVGSPDTQRCGDYQTAWAAAGSDSVETLVVTYTLSLHVTAVHIVQSFNPNQVVQVELLDAFDRPIEVYSQPPAQIDQPCPYVLSIELDRTDRLFNQVRITVDQSVLGLGWNQIDAVEMVGEPE